MKTQTYNAINSKNKFNRLNLCYSVRSSCIDCSNVRQRPSQSGHCVTGRHQTDVYTPDNTRGTPHAPGLERTTVGAM